MTSGEGRGQIFASLMHGRLHVHVSGVRFGLKSI